MSLVSCPECSRQVSDKAGKCIHCGFPLDASNGPKEIINSAPAATANKNKAESVMRKAVDFIFGLLYLYFIYMFFFSEEFSSEATGAPFYFAIAIGFAILYFIHKLIRAVLGTIGSMFD